MMDDDAMSLVMLYGPPGAGKTTVGRCLSEITGYRFFFNHLTVPAARAIFPEGEPQEAYFALLSSWRLAGIAAAAESKVNLIFTMAYSGAVDDAFIDKIMRTVRLHGGRVQFVELRAPLDVLMGRIGDESRKALAKLTDPQGLVELMATRDMTASVKYPDDILRIDTSKISPMEAAHEIASSLDRDQVLSPRPAI